MKVLMCHPQASAPAAAASGHQVNCVYQVNSARCVAHEEAALCKNLCVKRIGLYIFNRITSIYQT
jgi:hypothetical protein